MDVVWIKKLVDFLKSDEFTKEDITDFDVKGETKALDDFLASTGGDVPGLHYRPIVEVIKAAIQNAGPRWFHFTPFKQFWVPTPGAPAQRIFDEIYSSDAMVEAHTALQTQPAEPGCTLERVVLSLMWWSDSTHLASFGNVPLWPLYLFFGNQSKWFRVKPRSSLCHHVAYFPKLPDSFHDFFKTLTGKAPSYKVWTLLLDDDFFHAWEHGIVIVCADDYPEKVLLATIRNLGKCPSPTSTVLKEQFPEVGTVNDDRRRKKIAREDTPIRRGRIETVRKWIYQWGFAIKSAAVEHFLQPLSETPTVNAFSARLHKFNFNPFRMLVPDFMHEFELGVFKAFFIHLLRILVAHGGTATNELDRRFRLIPTFGQSTIRRFTENTSALKKLAAWNYQSILLCAIPVVNGLLPEPFNSDVLDALFTLAEWHSYAKLKMHTDSTIGLFKLGSLDGSFGASRIVRCRYGKSKARSRPAGTTNSKLYNLQTYKVYALGGYPATILFLGTTDSYSTQPGELQHKYVKVYYARTHKNNATRQMTQLERRDQFLRLIHVHAVKKGNIVMKTNTKHGRREKRKSPLSVSFEQSEPLLYTSPEEHHHLSHSQNYSHHLPSWLKPPQRTSGRSFKTTFLLVFSTPT
ncbi:hypothetical protein C8R46DRAFT_1234785 [Mycena filopes]|nr:hypothetical protein C8R46DRAFT_1234785 [Mycena filopes]